MSEMNAARFAALVGGMKILMRSDSLRPDGTIIKIGLDKLWMRPQLLEVGRQLGYQPDAYSGNRARLKVKGAVRGQEIRDELPMEKLGLKELLKHSPISLESCLAGLVETQDARRKRGTPPSISLSELVEKTLRHTSIASDNAFKVFRALPLKQQRDFYVNLQSEYLHGFYFNVWPTEDHGKFYLDFLPTDDYRREFYSHGLRTDKERFDFFWNVLKEIADRKHFFDFILRTNQERRQFYEALNEKGREDFLRLWPANAQMDLNNRLKGADTERIRRDLAWEIKRLDLKLGQPEA
jgi:hypothetical protein